MTEPTTLVPKDEGTPVPTGVEGESVALSPEQYNAMLDAIDELNDLKSQRQPPTVDSLANEGRGKSTPQGPSAEDLEDLKTPDLINFILQEVETRVSQPLMVKLEEMRIKDEIRELTREGKNKDFWNYKDDIYKVASRNPNLSIEEAFMLAKTKKGPLVEGDDGEKPKPLKNLPPRRTVPVGEKPGFSGTTVATAEPETRKAAANRAWDDLEKAGKT